jgi:hypothetical protein
MQLCITTKQLQQKSVNRRGKDLFLYPLIHNLSGHPKSNTQELPRIFTPAHSSTQLWPTDTASIRTVDTTFAHLHSTNNKE